MRIYVNPYDYSSTALNFIHLSQSLELQSRIVENGQMLLDTYPTHEERFYKILKIISKY